MTKPLVIVESPTKARTIARLLGDDYVVESSVGHIRDLPRSAKEIPDKVKSQPWARLGVDVEHGFSPIYVVPVEKRAQVKRLKDLLKDASELLLATDEDREGESIAWHLLEVLKPKVPTSRMVFHEITEQAIQAAIASPRALNSQLVEAQETRRILDRIYGYEVSPVLWKKVLPRLSAGRVQSVVCRLLVTRERERMAFVSASYADLTALLETTEGSQFQARLVELDGARLAQGRDFASDGSLAQPKGKDRAMIMTKADATVVADALSRSHFAVSSVEEKPYRRRPDPPYMTSTLQQDAGRRLRFSSSRTMSVAQRLYERGFITYMRTDSMTLSQEALSEARRVVSGRYGASSLPESPRVYRSKVKNAQEAHEAIRPSGEHWRAPETLGSQLAGDELKLYELIWRRTLACQMNDAVGTSVSVRIQAPLGGSVALTSGQVSAGAMAALNASVRVLSDRGYLAALSLSDDEDAATLPSLGVGDSLAVRDIEVEVHETQPPSRYSEAALIKTLEDKGIGRPSTYANIITTIIDRGYANKRGQTLVPTFVAFAVVNLLETHFPRLVDYDFTADMEGDLDLISQGELEAVPYLSSFYFGADNDGLHGSIEGELGQIDARAINTIPLATTEEGDVVVRVGRYGPYVQRGEETASLPQTLAPDELTLEMALEILKQGQIKDRVLGEVSGEAILLRSGRYGPYVQRGEGDGKGTPRASLLSYQTPDSLTLDDALALLALPRLVGVDPDSGTEILACNGRFGPYLSKGRDTRSLDNESQIFSVTLQDALVRFAEPKRRGTRRASSVDIGVDPETKAKIVLRSGRFGPYVSDGTVNASIPRGTDPNDLTLEAAIDLLAERRAKLGDTRE